MCETSFTRKRLFVKSLLSLITDTDLSFNCRRLFTERDSRDDFIATGVMTLMFDAIGPFDRTPRRIFRNLFVGHKASLIACIEHGDTFGKHTAITNHTIDTTSTYNDTNNKLQYKHKYLYG